MKFHLQLIWCLFLLGSLNAQVEVQYFGNQDEVSHLNKIDEKLYFGISNGLLDFNTGPNESRVYSFNNSITEKELVLNQINDSLDNVYLFNLYKKDNDIIVFGMSINNHTGERFLTTLLYDSYFENLINIELFPVEKMRTSFGYQSVKITNKTIWYFLEFDEFTNEGKSIVRVKFENGVVNWTRSSFVDEISYNRIYDVYLEEDKEILILNTTDNFRKFLCYDNELNLLYAGFQNTLYQDVSLKNPFTIILGGQDGNYTILERFSSRDGFILIKRQLIFVSDNIWISDDYKYLFPEDNSYLVVKYQKQDYTIVQYSNSSLDFSSDSYGFRIIYFDKKGEMNKQFEVKEESSMVLGYLKFYNDNTIAYGSGNWISPDFFFDPFIIKLTLSDTTTSTEDIYHEESPSLLLNNLIVDSKLRFIDNEIDLNRITVYDISGRQLLSGLSADGDISFLPVGHYVLRYDSVNGVLTERFVKVE